MPVKQSAVIEYEGNVYDRISQVADFIKTNDYIEYVEARTKRERTADRNKAFKIGTEVDLIIKSGLADGNLKPSSQETKNCLAAYSDWVTNYQPNMVENGVRLFNHELKITGEPDLLINGNEVSDLKCATAVRPAYWIQLGGYLLLPLNITATRASVIRLDKRAASYEYRVREDCESLKMLFISALNLYREFNRGV